MKEPPYFSRNLDPTIYLK